MIAYPELTKKLNQLLKEDQTEKREFGRAYFEKDMAAYEEKRAKIKVTTAKRAERMLQILGEVGEPSLSNIGSDGALAISVLAVHGSVDTLSRVLAAFMSLYETKREDTYYQAIPSMTDQLLILEYKPQRFGTQWLFDADKKPFLYPVEDMEHVNKRRKAYGIEPFRWPKSLAIPESEQPWLSRPLSELVMRQPTPEEYAVNFG